MASSARTLWSSRAMASFNCACRSRRISCWRFSTATAPPISGRAKKRPYILQTHAHILEHQDMIQQFQLIFRIIPVTVYGVFLPGAEHARLIVKDQRLLGHSVQGVPAPRWVKRSFIHILPKKRLDYIVTISFTIKMVKQIRTLCGKEGTFL